MRVRKRERQRHDSDHRAAPSVERGDAPDDRGIRVEVALPRGVTQHNDSVGAGHLFACFEPTSKERLDPEQREHRRRDLQSGQTDRITLPRQRCARQDVAGHVLDGARARTHGVEIARGQRAGAARDGRTATDVGRRSEDLHEAIGVVIRQRPQQHRADDAEDRRVGANPQRQRENRDRRESGSPPQGPEPVDHIEPQVVDPGERASVAMQIRRVRRAAERAPRSEARLVRGQAAADVFVLEQREMDVDFARDLLIGAFAAEHVQETKQETSHEDLVVSACRRTRSG